MIRIEDYKNTLEYLEGKMRKTSLARSWAYGNIQADVFNALPKCTPATQKVIDRLACLTPSIGPRVMQCLVNATVGSVQSEYEGISNYELKNIATRLLENALVSGVISPIVRRDSKDTLHIESLKGYIEPLYSLENSYEITGTLHAWASGKKQDKTTYTIRLYDHEAKDLIEYQNVTDIDKLDADSFTVIASVTEETPDGAPLPCNVVISEDMYCSNEGLFQKLIPAMVDEWKQHIVIKKVAEDVGFPQMVTKGKVEDGTNQRSSAKEIKTELDGDAKWLNPGDQSQAFDAHDRALERVRLDANLPGGFLNQGTTPSGEAMREANEKHIAYAKTLAGHLSFALSKVVSEYASVTDGLELGEQNTTVDINRSLERTEIIKDVCLLSEKNLMPLDVAVESVRKFFPHWTAEQAETFISLRNNQAGQSPEQILAELN